jgi:hypothetical protein
MVIGLITAFVGFITFLVREPLKDANLAQQLPAILGLAGLIMAGAGLAFIYLKRTRELDVTQRKLAPGEGLDELLGTYLTMWRRIEVAIRSLASTKLGESTAEEPISFLVRRLAKEKTLSKGDAEALQQLLATRNELAHSNRTAQQSDLLKSIREAQQILEKIENLSLSTA